MSSSDFQPYLDVAISVLSRKELSAVKKLKDFLQALPNAKQIEQILGTAILHFARNDASVFEWIIANQTLLKPELHLVGFTRRLMFRRMRDRGELQNPGFFPDLQIPLQLTPETLALLPDFLDTGELKLVKAVLLESQELI